MSKLFNIKSMKICNIIIIIVLATLLIILLYILMNKYNTKKIQKNMKINMQTKIQTKIQTKNNFEDATPIDASVSNVYGTTVPPVMGPPQECKAAADIVDYCIDYENCCSTNTANNGCFCNNPSVKSCKNQLDLCMQDPIAIKLYTKDQLTAKCKAQNNECCKAYNNIAISSNSFNDPIKRNQKDSIICTLAPIKNITQKCLELCQTNPDCAAYSTTNVSCNLYNKVSTNTVKIDPLTGKEITNTVIDYYTKK